MQTSTRYIALIIGLVVLTLGLTACGDSPTRAEFEALEQELITANNKIAELETAQSKPDGLMDRVGINAQMINHLIERTEFLTQSRDELNQEQDELQDQINLVSSSSSSSTRQIGALETDLSVLRGDLITTNLLVESIRGDLVTTDLLAQSIRDTLMEGGSFRTGVLENLHILEARITCIHNFLNARFSIYS